MSKPTRNRILGSFRYDADRDLPEFFDWCHVRQSLPSAGQHLPCAESADTAQRQGRKGLGVLQMSEIGDKANFWFAVIVIVTLLTDSIEGLL